MVQQQAKKRVGELIRLHRKMAGWTQEQLAERVGTSFSYIGALERGERNMTVDTLESIASALQIDFFDLLQPASMGSETTEYLLAIHLLLQAHEVNDQRRALFVLREMFRKD
ncbi:helix-turn-helix transcriptional regulator (plasmid) [Paenibacillus sonchi]|uniref:Helix-turn-helix transcriptional regulator n=1 Tax=Paenibacillus sonchi TaxID=373687 RepID=A0A974PID1_9BACL|nr:helix-turn-helix transcriptional regulator [Paenibacillus sonchi]QQZ64487.1 helix-turn-helix transcriptional regulator [Paenibacillus sonchi]